MEILTQGAAATSGAAALEDDAGAGPRARLGGVARVQSHGLHATHTNRRISISFKLPDP